VLAHLIAVPMEKHMSDTISAEFGRLLELAERCRRMAAVAHHPVRMHLFELATEIDRVIDRVDGGEAGKRKAQAALQQRE
jgi:hypothetical protein